MRIIPLPDAPQRAGDYFDRALKEKLETPQPVSLPILSVQQLQALTPNLYGGMIARCSNGDAGDECLAYCNGRAWHVIALGNRISAT